MARAYRFAAPLVALGGAALLQAGALDRLIPGSETEQGYMSSDSPWAIDAEPAEPSVADSVHFANCDAARAAGAAPLYYGEPGYREGMDGDGDGVACEPYYGR